MKQVKIFLFVALIFAIGAAGGIAGERILFPYLASKHPFSKMRFVRSYGTTIIYEEIKEIIRENEVLEGRIRNVASSVVPVVTRNSLGQAVTTATGFILTSDGLVVTASNVLRSGLPASIYFDGDFIPSEPLETDSETGIVLLKAESSNFPVVSFGSLGDTKLGETVFLFGKRYTEKDNEGRITRFVNSGIISIVSEDDFATTISEKRRDAMGSPLFDIEGKLLGMHVFNLGGELVTVRLEDIFTLMKNTKN